ncbi:acyl-[acyl-carrier-protein]--UDP-N-acetylglucosamine O-acyltransferase, partial [Corallococcus praedator]
LAGHVYVESGARFSGLIGVHQFVRVGRMAMIGGMSRIERDVPPYMLVEGNPARVRSLNLIGLKRAGVELTALKKAFRLLYRSGLTLNEAIAQFDLLPDSEPLHHLRQFLEQTQLPDRRGVIPGKRAKVRSEE